MLVINGANDLPVPQADTFVVEGRAKTEVHMLPDTGTAPSQKQQLSISSNPKYLAFAQQFRDGLAQSGDARGINDRCGTYVGPVWIFAAASNPEAPR